VFRLRPRSRRISIGASTRAFRAVDLCFRGPLASCAPGRVTYRLRLPTASARSGSGHPSGFAGSRRGRSLFGSTCSVGSDGIFRSVSSPLPAPEGAGGPARGPKASHRCLFIDSRSSSVRRPANSGRLRAQSASKIRRPPSPRGFEDSRCRKPEGFRILRNSSKAAACSLSAEASSCFAALAPGRWLPRVGPKTLAQ
jgi:hypothetical protein